MISQLRGTVIETNLEKDSLRAVLDVHGVGYEVFLPRTTHGRLPRNEPMTLFVSESVTAYGGATTLYGFVSREEKDFFTRIRENVGGVGPKKALECIEKISKSLPDFKRAIVDGDGRLLVSVFGFTKKTAEKLIFALKDKVGGWSVQGPEKWAGLTSQSKESQALSGLVNLGYGDLEAREAVDQAKKKLGETSAIEDLLKESIRLLSARLV